MFRFQDSSFRGWLPAGLLPVCLLLAPLACRPEDPEIRELTKKAAQADEASRRLRQAWREQAGRLAGLGMGRDLPEAPLVLSEPQRRFLERRVQQERDSSRRALLAETLRQDGAIRALAAEVAGLQAELPPPEVVRRNDSHYGMALRFLKGRGCSDGAARRILARAGILPRVAPGFEVYHFFHEGTYGTWVAQGSAAVSPQELATGDLEPTAARRDEALRRRSRLQRELADLEAERSRIEAEIAEVRGERRRLAVGNLALQEARDRQAESLNALHYRVGVRDDLRRAGLIETPLFDKARSGRRWRDAAFDRSLDLRVARTLQIRARDLGLARIGRVDLVPGSYLEGEHYRLTLSGDRQTATVELLAPQRFKNDKVVFAVTD